jgi:methyl-accepting chemotaxis protein
MRSQLAAISLSQSIVSFSLTGDIIGANATFLRTTGYSLDELVGKPHSFLCEASFVTSGQYGQFWNDLPKRVVIANDVKRIGKAGKEIWLNAVYTPVLRNGTAVKVIEFATGQSLCVSAVCGC